MSQIEVKKLAYESVVEINGVVRPRPDGQENKVYISYKMGYGKDAYTIDKSSWQRKNCSQEDHIKKIIETLDDK